MFFFQRNLDATRSFIYSSVLRRFTMTKTFSDASSQTTNIEYIDDQSFTKTNTRREQYMATFRARLEDLRHAVDASTKMNVRAKAAEAESKRTESAFVDACVQLDATRSQLENLTSKRKNLERTITATTKTITRLEDNLDHETRRKTRLDQSLARIGSKVGDVEARIREAEEDKAREESLASAALVELEEVRKRKNELLASLNQERASAFDIDVKLRALRERNAELSLMITKENQETENSLHTIERVQAKRVYYEDQMLDITTKVHQNIADMIAVRQGEMRAACAAFVKVMNVTWYIESQAFESARQNLVAKGWYDSCVTVPSPTPLNNQVPRRACPHTPASFSYKREPERQHRVDVRRQNK